MKRKAEMEHGTTINGNHIKQLMSRKTSNGPDSSSDDDEADIEDMGLFGGKLAQFKK